MNENFTPLGVPTTVVVEEKRKKKAALWIAGGAAALLLAGGSSFALWQDTAVFTGGTITAGNLDLQTDGTTQYYEVSLVSGNANPTTAGSGLDTTGLRNDEVDTIANTTGKGQVIDPSTWRIVPGDTIAAIYTATVVLKGDNLVANLTASGLESATPAASGGGGATYDSSGQTSLGVTTGNAPTSNNNSLDNTDSEVIGDPITGTPGFTDNNAAGDLTYNYVLYRDGGVIGSGAVPANGVLASFSNGNPNQGVANVGGTSPVVVPLNGGSSVVTVVITVNFNKNVEHRQDVTASEALAPVKLGLVQALGEGAQAGS